MRAGWKSKEKVDREMVFELSGCAATSYNKSIDIDV
jgi:hypothetical protein